MDALEAIYRAEEKWTDVIDVKMQRADALEEPAEQRSRSSAASPRSGATRPASPTARARRYEKILEIDPTHDEAFAELEKLHTAAGRWEPLVELYLARLETREETAEKTELLRKIARVFEEKLDDKDQALDALVNALADGLPRPRDRSLPRADGAGDGALGRGHPDGRTDGSSSRRSPSEKIRLCLHLAKWYGDDLGHPEYAQPYYAQIIQLDPHNVGAMRQLASLYKKAANWQQIGATLTRALDVATTRSRPQGDPERPRRAARRADEPDRPGDRATSSARSRSTPRSSRRSRTSSASTRRAGRTASSSTSCSARCRRCRTRAEIAATKLRIAALYETSLGDALARVAGLPRGRRRRRRRTCRRLRGLARVYELLEQWPELVERPRERSSTSSRRSARGSRSSCTSRTLQEEHFLKADLAAQRLEQVLEIDPNNEDAYFKLERNYRKLRQWLDLINTYDRHIAATLERKTKVELYGAIAQVYADEVEDTERAIDAYKNIVDLDEQNVPALDALAKLYEKLDDAAQSIDYMTRVADLTQDSQAAGRGVLPASARRSTRSSAIASRRKSATRWRSISIRRTCRRSRRCGRSRSTTPTTTRRRDTIDQEQSYTPAPRQRAQAARRARQAPRRDARRSRRAPSSRGRRRTRPIPRTRTRRCRSSNEYVAKEHWEKAEPLLDLLMRKGGKRERGEQHDAAEQARARLRRRSARTTRRSRRTRPRTSST